MGKLLRDFLFRASSNYGLWGFPRKIRVAGGPPNRYLQVEIDYDLAEEPAGSRLPLLKIGGKTKANE